MIGLIEKVSFHQAGEHVVKIWLEDDEHTISNVVEASFTMLI